jgi:hypothetical protein
VVADDDIDHLVISVCVPGAVQLIPRLTVCTPCKSERPGTDGTTASLQFPAGRRQG